MNLESVIKFLERVYENPEGRNLTRLEHEAIGEAMRRLKQLSEHLDSGRNPVSHEPHLTLVRDTKDEKE